MAKSLFWLSDAASETLEPHLPRGKPRKPRADDRIVLSGILHVLKTGYRWRDVPPVIFRGIGALTHICCGSPGPSC